MTIVPKLNMLKYLKRIIHLRKISLYISGNQKSDCHLKIKSWYPIRVESERSKIPVSYHEKKLGFEYLKTFLKRKFQKYKYIKT